MQCWVYHQGVPLGTAELGPGEQIVAEFEPAAGYASVRGVIRQASVALWSMGFFQPEFALPEFARPRGLTEALGRAAALPLELRDGDGKLIPADYVNIVERVNEEEGPVVFVRFRHAHAGVPSRLPDAPRSAGDDDNPPTNDVAS